MVTGGDTQITCVNMPQQKFTRVKTKTEKGCQDVLVVFLHDSTYQIPATLLMSVPMPLFGNSVLKPLHILPPPPFLPHSDDGQLSVYVLFCSTLLPILMYSA